MLKLTSPATVATLAALTALGPLATDMYLPAMPAMAEALGTGPERVQLTLSFYMAGFALAQLFCGPLSDRFGRRPVMIGGFALFLVASLLCAFAPNIEWRPAGRFLQALGGAAGPVLARAAVRDIHEPLEAAQVLSYMASTMAMAHGPGPGGGGRVIAVLRLAIDLPAARPLCGGDAGDLHLAAAGAAARRASPIHRSTRHPGQLPHAARPARLHRLYPHQCHGLCRDVRLSIRLLVRADRVHGRLTHPRRAPLHALTVAGFSLRQPDQRPLQPPPGKRPPAPARHPAVCPGRPEHGDPGVAWRLLALGGDPAVHLLHDRLRHHHAPEHGRRPGACTSMRRLGLLVIWLPADDHRRPGRCAGRPVPRRHLPHHDLSPSALAACWHYWSIAG